MVLNYGVNSSIGSTIGQSPIEISLVTPMIFGAWPADTGSGKSKEIYKVTSYDDYKANYVDEAEFGELKRDDGWNGHKTAKTWLENGLYPVLIYNAFDPATHKADVADENATLAAGTAELANKYVIHSTVADLKSDGAIDKATTLNAGGTGYAIGEIITVESGTGSNGKIEVLTLGASDAVATFKVIDGGTLFADSDAITQTSSTGSGTSATFVGSVPATAYTEDTDYTVTRVAGETVITAVSTGDIPAAFKFTVDYSYADPDLSLTEKKAAIDKIDDVFVEADIPITNLPKWVHAPGWTHKKATAETTDDVEAVRNYIAAKSMLMLDFLQFRFLYDIDETAYNSSSDVADLKADKTTLHANGRSCMGEGTLNSETEALGSDIYFATLAALTVANDFPGETPSNKSTQINGYVPTNLFVQSKPTAQDLRDYGILCPTKPFTGGNPAFWGTFTSLVDGTPDAIDYSKRVAPQNDINVHLLTQITVDIWATMYDFGLSQNRIDAKLATWNNTLGNLVSTDKLTDGRLEFRPEDNPDITDNLKFRLILMGPVYPNTIEIELNVDLNAIKTLFPTA